MPEADLIIFDATPEEHNPIPKDVENELDESCIVNEPKNPEDYLKMYEFSVTDPDRFWHVLSEDFEWKQRPENSKILHNFEWRKGEIHIKWMDGAKTNICYNVLDRNIKKGLSDKVAFYWEGNESDEASSITYGELHKEVCKFANVLKSKGIKKGDRVTIYMPMILELPIAMLACARIGAIHNVVFGGFSSDSLAERIIDSESNWMITADGAWRGTKIINLKEIADEAIQKCGEKELNVKCIVVRHVGRDREERYSANSYGHRRSHRTKKPMWNLNIPWNSERDFWYHIEMENSNPVCEPEWIDSEHPLFILYTSGSTGKPKGVLHTTGGYMVYTATTFRYTFAHKADDIYFCTADIGWITGHSYGVYGPLLEGATCIMFQGIPIHPDPGRYWAVCEKYKVSKFYTAPTAIRTLMKYGDSFVEKYDLSSLKVLGTVGEPINPEAWQWYYDVVGNKQCHIVDTYWQSETGGHVLTPLPGCTPPKPGSAAWPFFGVVPAILDDHGNEIEGPGEGHLVFKQPWPGMMRSLFSNPERFASVYFNRFPGYYSTGDGARRDTDGYYWITGRMDDMLNVSGHLLSTAEVESALIEHDACVEAAAVSHPHDIKGECLYCFVILRDGFAATKELSIQLREKVREKIGSFAAPEYIHFTSVLPKTRSGKIMRRILRKICRGDSDLGDLSTLADPTAIDIVSSSKPQPLYSRINSCSNFS